MSQQALACSLHAIVSQRPACEQHKAIAGEQQDQEQEQAEHGSRQRQAETACYGLANQLAEQDETETCEHDGRIKGCAAGLVNWRATRGPLREATLPSACRSWWRSAWSCRRARQRPWPRRRSVCGRA